MYCGAMVLLHFTHVNYSYYILSIFLVGFMYKAYLIFEEAQNAPCFDLLIAILCAWVSGIIG